ncbi:GM12549 [Drosophila sechellia]|uniref:GM12549 n=1 Tax=Drosophila sechellia TaxID=7238 RepID=B4I051_DROSE|nr:GM12549 [Drosophila sechellia]
MRVLNTELRLRFKNRKPRPFNRAASADDALDLGSGVGVGTSIANGAGIGVGATMMPLDQRLNGATTMKLWHVIWLYKWLLDK